MDEPSTTSRQLNLQELPAFCTDLAERLREQGLDDDRIRSLFGQGLGGECIQCAVRVTGDELLGLTNPAPATTGLSPRTARLNQGYCARHDCPSYFYRIEFRPVPGIDWAILLNPVQSGSDPNARPGLLNSAGLGRWIRSPTRRTVLQLGVGIILALFLLLIRQWYIGGTIPWIRQPEPFSVDPASVTGQPER
jgi:hypothetical protein